MKKQETPIKILMLGSLPPPIGGVRVLTAQLVDFLRHDPRVSLTFINISAFNKSGVRNAASLLFSACALFCASRGKDIIVIGARAPFDILYYLAAAPCRLLAKKKIIMRKFAGNFDMTFEGLKPFYNWLYRHFLFSADLWLFETKTLVNTYADTISNVQWFPNCRQMPPPQTLQIHEQCRRFVYVGHVNSEKGIEVIIEAGERFAEHDITVDIYGPLRFDISPRHFQGLRKVCYRGEVEPGAVVSLLQGYDAFLMPTFFSGEGYPGTILESYAAGLPVICTRWRALPEIVDEASGILIEPRNAGALYRAMQMLVDNSDYYVRLREGVLEKRGQFSAEYWNRRFVQFCEALVKQGGSNTYLSHE